MFRPKSLKFDENKKQGFVRKQVQEAIEDPDEDEDDGNVDGRQSVHAHFRLSRNSFSGYFKNDDRLSFNQIALQYLFAAAPFMVEVVEPKRVAFHDQQPKQEISFHEQFVLNARTLFFESHF